MAKTGIDILEELVQEIKQLRQEVKILDINIKKVANSAKLAELLEDKDVKGWSKPKPKAKPSVQVKAFNPEEKAAKPQSNIRFNFETDKVETKPISNNCLCQGKMVAKSGDREIPIPNVSIKIYDDKDNLVKETKTNRAGIWMSKLPLGKYVALCEGTYQDKQLNPVNLMFEVTPGLEKLEVN